MQPNDGMSRMNTFMGLSDVLGSSLMQPPSDTDDLESSFLKTSFSYSEERASMQDLGSSLILMNIPDSNPTLINSHSYIFPHLEGTSPDSHFSQQNNEDILGSSLLYSPNRNTLLDNSKLDILGSSLVHSPINGSPFSEDRSFIKEDTTDILDETDISDNDLRLAELIESIRGPKFTSTPSKVQRELKFDRVKAKQQPDKPISSYIHKEVASAKKMKKKALNPKDVQTSMKMVCFCGEKCMEKFSPRTVRQLREGYWCQSQTVRRQMLKVYLNKSASKGKFRFIFIKDNVPVCSKAFLQMLRINKNSLTHAFKLIDKDSETLCTPGRCPKKKNENSLTAINWLEDYASFYGDRMPNSGDVKLPYKARKLSVYQSYREDADNPVSKSQFFKIWKNYFPHLKIKQTNSFSKCSTCSLLEKQRENAIDFETKAMYSQLKDAHHERQHMERRYYYGKRDFSRKCPLQSMSLIIDGMDQAKTNLPHFAGRRSKCVNPADLLKTHITGVINHGMGGFHTYIDVNEYPHDPNLTLNVLLKALKKAAERNENILPPILYIQADNCGRENKNRYVLAFLELLVAENIFREIHLSFLYVGHTHEDVDAAFSKVSQKLKTTDIETLPELLDTLPESESIGTIYDVKSWIEPYISKMEKISYPLHYKFEKYDNSVRWFFKGTHNSEWIQIEDNILTKLPQGQPKSLKPDYSKINIDKNLKQVKQLKNLFKSQFSMTFWEEFYKNINDGTRYIPHTNWILNQLPRQQVAQIEISAPIPDYVREIVNKETTVPQVIVKKKKVTGQQKNHSRISKEKGRVNDSKQTKTSGKRKRVVKRTRTLVIPLMDDVKRHIWIMIFILILDVIAVSFFLLFLMTLLHNLYTLFTLLNYILNIWLETVTLHIGILPACVNQIMVTFIHRQP